MENEIAFLKRKKADIAITILVIGIIALCTLTLLSFYLAGSRQTNGMVKSAYFLGDIYNVADSVSYSGSGYYAVYRKGMADYKISPEMINAGDEVVIERTYLKKDLGLAGGSGEEAVRVSYTFVP